MISLRGRAPGVAVVVASGVALAIAGPGLALPGGAGPVAAHHLVEIRGLRFEPAGLVVTAGDTVTWVNRDVVPHTATAADEAWTSGELGPGGSWSRIAGTGGGWEYVCAYHPEMRGRVVVKRARPAPR